MHKTILQAPSTFETRTVAGACMLVDGWNLRHVPYEKLNDFESYIKAGAMPVGSVEFVRKAMRYAGVQEPQNITYPKGSEAHLHREITKGVAGKVISHCFVKPVTTKAFTGFVFQPIEWVDSPEMEEFVKVDFDTEIWISEVVEWLCEWRYYIFDGEILASARYDQGGSKEAPLPDLSVVKQCIKDIDIWHPYALDMGVLKSGKTALVEVNDAWAIGLYRDCMHPRDYLKFLKARWDEIFRVSNPAAA